MIGKISKYLFLSVFYSSVFLIIYLFYHGWNSGQTQFNRVLDEAIQSGQTHVKISDVTDFEWSNVCYFKYRQGRHSNDQEAIEELIGRRPYTANLPDYRCDTTASNALIFLLDHKEVIFNVDRCGLEFNDRNQYQSKNSCYGNDAILNLTRFVRIE